MWMEQLGEVVRGPVRQEDTTTRNYPQDDCSANYAVPGGDSANDYEKARRRRRSFGNNPWPSSHRQGLSARWQMSHNRRGYPLMQ